MPTIKITDDRQGRTFRTGVNGKLFDLAINQEINVTDEMVDHLRGIGVRFDEVDTKRANSSEEGSGEGLVRAIGPHDVSFPGTAAKSADDRIMAGDQPGDVTTAGATVAFSDAQAPEGDNIKDHAEAANKRVAAERVAPKDAPVAELAGEGEGGTKKADAQPVEPTHKEAASAPTTARKTARKGK
jgi:hypothetical protein